MKINFKESIKKCYTYDEYAFNNKEWKLLKTIYDKYDENNISIKIPKIIHQIWLGGKLPEKYEKLTKTWKDKNPDWQYFLWTDDNISELNIINKDKFLKANNPGMKSDILRYEVLYQYGGIYVDTDFQCLSSFDKFLNLDFFTGIAYNTTVELYIGLIGCIPKHKIIEDCILNMKSVREGNWEEIFNSTGTYYFTRNFINNITENSENIVAFPPSYFYPFPNNMRRSDLNGFDNNDLEKLHSYIKEESCAIHWWHVSWLN